MTIDPAADDDEGPALAAVARSTRAGFAFCNIPDKNGDVLAIYGERTRSGAVDVFVMAGQDEAWAARYRAGDYKLRPNPDPLWHLTGTAADVVTALLELPVHGTPGAPVRAYRVNDGPVFRPFT